jgi:fibro-slime domain-containing protein
MKLGSRLRITASLAFVSLIGAVHCSGNPDVSSAPGIPSGGASGTSDTDASMGGSGAGLNVPTGDAGQTSTCDPANGDSCGGASNAPDPTCGDGLINVDGEVCDDGNTVSGDGCTADCAQIEANFACPTPGQPCVSTVKCGDGVITGNEQCDDGNAKSGDGCDETCQLEPGWSCEVMGLPCAAAECGDGILAGLEECEYAKGEAVGSKPGCSATCTIVSGYDCATSDPFACAATVCGNKIVERGEQCDDGNALAFDGCYKCKSEPSCTDGVCKSVCGDGQRYDDEECDDGNNRDNDGCSSTCKIEKGFTCTDITTDPPASIPLPVTLRDFIGHGNQLNGKTPHPDFNQLNGSGVLGIAGPTLDANDRMVYSCPGGDCTKNPGANYYAGAAYPNTSGAANFAQWYTDVPGVNLTIPSELVLARGTGTTTTYLYDSGVSHDNGAGVQVKYFDPLHAQGWLALGDEKAPCDPGQNLSFTTETHFWFEYQGGETFAFSGDDDTWVFVNGHLAVDLGGLHTPLTGTFTLDADTDGTGPDTADGTAQVTQSLITGTQKLDFGLKPNGIYEVVMFQAERNQCGSNFKVTLKDFNKPKSQCVSDCGDGIVASDEVCDDGKNDGSYGGCEPGCKARGPYCGDGKKQAQEQCDDGVNLSQYGGCAPGCVNGPTCGDGIVQSGFEQCDDGVNSGAYGKCAKTCVFGPRCGDGILQSMYEQCDDGNRMNGDDCDANCHLNSVK